MGNKIRQSSVLNPVTTALVAWVALCSCATNYRFLSQPSEANVSYVNGAQKTLLGQTPIDFGKQTLPTDSPFILVFEKPGFERKEVSVAPSDNTLTTINVMLKPAADAQSDESLKRTSLILQQIFAIQEKIAQSRYVDALASLKDLQDKEPHLAETHVLRGSVYVLLNDKEQAKREWETAVKLAPHLDSLRVRLQLLDQDIKLGGGKP